MPARGRDDAVAVDESDPLHNKQVGIRLAQARLTYGQKQRAWAGTLKVAPNHVSQWESGYSVPNRWRLIQYKQITGVTIDWILTGDRSGMLPPLLNALDTAILHVGHDLWEREDP